MLTLPIKSRKRHLGCTEDLEDGELPDVDASDLRSMQSIHSQQTLGQFSDGFDEQLMGDAADRARLEALSELERESELYERSLRREELLYKWSTKCILLAKEKHADVVDRPSALPEVAAAFKERSSTRRANAESQRAADKRRSAFDRLVAQRNRKRTKHDLACKHITGALEEQLPEEQTRCESPKQDVKKLKLKARDIYSDESSGSTDDECTESSSPLAESEILISSLKDISKALLTRTQLESFLDKPIFDQTVIGCFVRISLSGIPSSQPPIYRLTQIVAVEHIEQEYPMGNRRTRRLLQLQHGLHLRSFQMDAVSNQPAINSEFSYWLSACQRDSVPLPSVQSIAKKQKDIESATNYAFTEGDVELMVQTKQRAGQKPVSAAYRKVCLIMERDMALGSNDLERANRLEREIKQIDEQSLSEYQRVKRVQYMSSHTVSSAVLPLKEPAAKSRPKKFDWQQYMRRRYKKFAHQSGLQSERKQSPAKASTEPAVKPAPSEQSQEQSQEASEANLDKLDLYELHNFEINLDVSKLTQFSEICEEIEGIRIGAGAL